MQKNKALLLISSGIDSPVAGHLMKEKGLELIGIHFNNEPFTDSSAKNKSIKLCKLIGIKKLYIIGHGKNQTANLRNINRRFQCVICRRMMFRVSEKIAKKEKCKFLITGENLGQVASQTLDNLVVCQEAVKIPILRPLLCNDKVETIKIAANIGTYETSIEPGMCCNMVPRNPLTRASLEKVKGEEKRLDINSLVDESVKSAEVVYL